MHWFEVGSQLSVCDAFRANSHVSVRLFFMFAPWCHCAHLPQSHNDADCVVSVEQVSRMHDKGFVCPDEETNTIGPTI